MNIQELKAGLFKTAYKGKYNGLNRDLKTHAVSGDLGAPFFITEQVEEIIDRTAQTVLQMVEDGLPDEAGRRERGYVLPQTTEKEEGWNNCRDEVLSRLASLKQTV